MFEAEGRDSPAGPLRTSRPINSHAFVGGISRFNCMQHHGGEGMVKTCEHAVHRPRFVRRMRRIRHSHAGSSDPQAAPTIVPACKANRFSSRREITGLPWSRRVDQLPVPPRSTTGVISIHVFPSRASVKRPPPAIRFQPHSREPSEPRDGWELLLVGDLSEKQNELTETLLDVAAGSRGTIYFDSNGGSAYVGITLAGLIRLRNWMSRRSCWENARLPRCCRFRPVGSATCWAVRRSISTPCIGRAKRM